MYLLRLQTLIIFCLFNFLLPQRDAYAAAYPPEIQKRIESADANFVCETEMSRKVTTIVYLNRDEDWLVRIFTENDEKLEIWLNTSVSWSPIWLWLSLAKADKIYYRVDEQWLDKKDLPEEESQRLYDRLRFTVGERSFFIECFKQKMRPAS